MRSIKMTMKKAAVTGAFGYSGKYIAEKLLDEGFEVITLTNSVNRENSFNGKIKVHPFNFDKPELLTEQLQGVDVLYNTYWVRFNHKTFSYKEAVKNSKILFECAKKAGVRKIVHTSITNPSKNSPFEYFSGKAELEEVLQNSGMEYSILRPGVLFGKEDILINNIVWTIRKFPFVFIFGNGEYRLQPIHVKDYADLAFQSGQNHKSEILNAIGPETYSYKALYKKIMDILNIKRPIFSAPDWLSYLAGNFIGLFVGDVVITKDEIEGLSADLLYVEDEAYGKTKLSEWLIENQNTVGLRYTSELKRRLDRKSSYSHN